MEPTFYDASEEYMAKISPMIRRLLDACEAAGVALVGLTVFGCHETTCNCGQPGCQGVGIGHMGENFGVADTRKASELLLAVHALIEMRPDVQSQFCQAIIMANQAIDDGATVKLTPRVDSRWN